ncbi:MAG: DUF4468 domain-containing protein [Cyclobacteriaceae bacterium]|nr:DUF4468 domain-containing protein [Cyclobacteriaceae bacterium]
MRVFLIIILLLTVVQISNGQEKLLDILPLQDGVVTYTKVVQVEGVTKDELYLRAKKWFVTTYKSAKDVIQLDDKESGTIVGKGNFRITYYAREPLIDHTISISVKDGRFKYEIKDLVYSDKQGDKFAIENFPKGWAGRKKLYETIDKDINSIIESIERGIKTKIGDDW